jgi:hypothetical protein
MAIDTRNSDPSIVELVRSAAADTTELVKQQIELTKAEVQQSVKTAGSSFGILAGGAAVLGIGAIFLLVTIAYVIAVWLPVWAGFGIVTLVLFIVGAILVVVGRKRAKTISGPERSVAALEATKATFRG